MELALISKQSQYNSSRLMILRIFYHKKMNLYRTLWTNQLIDTYPFTVNLVWLARKNIERRTKKKNQFMDQASLRSQYSSNSHPATYDIIYYQKEKETKRAKPNDQVTKITNDWYFESLTWSCRYNIHIKFNPPQSECTNSFLFGRKPLIESS